MTDDGIFLLFVGFIALFIVSLVMTAIEGKKLNALSILLNVFWTFFIMLLPVLFLLFIDFLEHMADVVYDSFLK